MARVSKQMHLCQPKSSERRCCDPAATSATLQPFAQKHARSREVVNVVVAVVVLAPVLVAASKVSEASIQILNASFRTLGASV